MADVPTELLKIRPFSERPPLSEADVHPNPLLNRVYRNRGVSDASELSYGLDRLLSPFSMKGVKEASEIIADHLEAQSNILIVGDYDCDGATSTTIAVEGLRLLGAQNVDFIIPDRVIHGYGISPSIVSEAAKYEPDLIITVDNGISAFDGVQAVKDLEHPCQIVVTDHHLPAESGKIPNADAVVDPSQPGCEFESPCIAGCGVIFYVVLGVRSELRDRGYYTSRGIIEPGVAQLLDVVALGTVADVVPLDYNNRLLVNAGLQRINAGHCRVGLRAILEAKKREIGKIVAADFGFAAGPCINAAGRLEDMSIGIRCLLETNRPQADLLARQLVELNEKRKSIESEMVEEAIKNIGDFSNPDDGVVVFGNEWHEGVVGIVASRIKEKADRPVICFTETEPLRVAKKRLESMIADRIDDERRRDLMEIINNGEIKGSARSIKGVHLKHVLDRINKRNPELLSKFGGHAMAAGLSIKLTDLDRFKEMFVEEVSKELTQKMRIGAVEVDIRGVDPRFLDLEIAEELETQIIWGQGFEPPLFSSAFTVTDRRIVGEKHLKLKLIPEGGGSEIDAISFNSVRDGFIPVRDRIEASFRLGVNEWKGRRSLQLMIEHMQDEDFVYDLTNGKDDSFDKMGGAAKDQPGTDLTFNP